MTLDHDDEFFLTILFSIFDISIWRRTRTRRQIVPEFNLYKPNYIVSMFSAKKCTKNGHFCSNGLYMLC